MDFTFLVNTSDKVFLELEKVAENNKPSVTVSNDSVGWTEAWGVRQYDNQPDYLEIEETEDTLYVALPFAQRLIEKIVRDLNTCKDDLSSLVTVSVDKGKYDVVEADCHFKVVEISEQNKAIRFDIEYTEIDN